MTELVRARQEIAAREHEYRTLASSLPDTVMRYDLEGRAIYVNHRVGTDPDGQPTAVLGLRPTEVDLPGLTGSEEYERRLMHVIATGAPGEAELVVPTPVGRRVHSLLIRAEHDDQGAISGAISSGATSPISCVPGRRPPSVSCSSARWPRTCRRC